MKHDLIAKEIKKCSKDFPYFCKKYLKIVDKHGNLVLLKPNQAQYKYLNSLENNPWMYVLKARQLGLTTIIAAKLFHKCLFTPNYRVGVLAHTKDAAKNIFEIYRRYYNNLPKFLRFKTEAANVNELVFFHGGYIKVGSASSQSFRGSTYNSLHLSEFAYYDNIEQTIQSVFQTVTPGGDIILETTANGMNDAHKIWLEDNGFEKVFISWLDHKEYKSYFKPKRVKPYEKEFIEDYKLKPTQANWFVDTLRTKCLNNIDTFNQEYPTSDDIAFITTGQSFFNSYFAVPDASGNVGWKYYTDFQKFRTYILGVDTASGTPTGDYSAAVLIDITDRKKAFVVATFYDRLPLKAYARQLLKVLSTYSPLVVVESNSYGLAILETLQEEQYPHLYRRTKFDKFSDRWTEHLGFATTLQSRPVLLGRLHQWVSSNWLRVGCDRIKWEMNHFVYNAKGKPEADSGKHDDLIIATGLALMGLDQVTAYEEVVQLERRPSNIKELCQWEISTGKLYKDSMDQFSDPNENTDLSPTVGLEVI